MQSRHIEFNDWKPSSQARKLSAACDDAVFGARKTRFEADQTRSAADTRSEWIRHRTRANLESWIEDVRHWKQALERSLHEVEVEMSILQDAIEQAENVEQNRLALLQVSQESVIIRDQLREAHGGHDPIHKECIAEIALIKDTAHQFHQEAQFASNIHAQLKSIQSDIRLDLKNKHKAIEMDKEQLHSKQNGITLRSTLPKYLEGMVPVQFWEESSHELQIKVHRLLEEAWRSRRNIHALYMHTSASIKAQQDAVDYELRKKLHDLQLAITELEWQRQNMLEELLEIQAAQQRLDKSLCMKLDHLKMAQTCLEQRLQRPLTELCCDNAHMGLLSEVDTIHETQEALRAELERTRHEEATIFHYKQTIEANIHSKKWQYGIEKQCLDLRKNQITGQYAIPHEQINLYAKSIP